MPLDALCLSAVKNELAEQIIGMKTDKITQPERDVIVLSLRGHGSLSSKLLISAGPGDSRVHLTSHKFENPQTPPMFCMLLRKHLTGAKIIDIYQLPSDRVLRLRFEAVTSLGIKTEKSLIIEMIGQLTNIILTDESGLIIDCLRRIGGDFNNKRSVLPGLIYRDPPRQEGKNDPLEISKSSFTDLIENAPDLPADKWLNSTFSAFSPLICRELIWRAYKNPDLRILSLPDTGEALINEFYTLIEQIKSGSAEPWLISDKNIPKDFSFTQIKQYENIFETIRAESFSKMLDDFFTCSAQLKRINQKSSSTIKLMNTARDRQIRKLASQKSEMEDTAKRDYFRECGDLITANIHLMTKGQNTLIADDFYSENNEKRKIELDPMKTPQQNSAKYYKAYTKAKNARKYLEEQIKSGENELEYIESVTEQLLRTENEHDLNDIRNELMQTGYIKNRVRKTEKKAESVPYKFITSSGITVTAGKNNVQNDKLTLKTASKSDVWMHAKQIHGTHVIIHSNGKDPDENTLYEAAVIAAYYSAARSDSKVPVDYTLVKNVKKSPGGRPGMVIYNDFKTIIAEPNEAFVKNIMVHKK